ncbi:MAG: hypothetical protein KF833_15920 [Verrucomicrobiae bacterium]|nr:hypothetical protein [Verrucomicrobiae bacterium]
MHPSPRQPLRGWPVVRDALRTQGQPCPFIPVSRIPARVLGLGLLIALAGLTARMASAGEAVSPSSPAGRPAHALILAGGGAHAELPVAPVRDLSAATIECWVRWDELGASRRIFNYGRPRRDLSLMSRDGRDLALVSARREGGLRWLVMSDIVPTGRWVHVAASLGHAGMRLHLNGVPLLPVHPHTGSFADASPDGRFLLGRSVTDADRETPFRGAIAEFRVWDRERTTEEIRADLFRSVEPGESGLVLLARFEPGQTLAGLRDGARIEAVTLPGSAEGLDTVETLQGGPGRTRISAGGHGERLSGAVGISFVGGLLTAFCLLHALLFAFQPGARAHLYFALISGLGATMSWPLLALWDVTQHWLPVLAVLVLRLFQLLFAPGDRPPARGLVGLAVTCSVVLLVNELFFTHTGLVAGTFGVAGVGVIVYCAIRVVAIAVRAWRTDLPGSRSIGCGLGALIILAGAGVEAPLLGGITFNQLGVVAFFCATSVHLARGYAMATRKLEEQTRDLAESNRRLRGANEEIERQRQELAAAKELADAANTAKSRFLASVSHELRTPLNAIIGYSEMLAEEAPESGAQKLVPDLERIQIAARHQLELINDILDLSKIEAGRLEAAIEPIEVPPVVHSVAGLVAPLMARNGNRFVVDCPTDLPPLRSDPTRLRQILFNLLSNASKFTTQGDVRLEVRASASRPRTPREADSPPANSVAPPDTPGVVPPSPPQDILLFAVRDTGIGIHPEQLQRIFEPFSQADARTHAQYGGTGLGLAISRRFARMLGGDLDVTSEPGRGSVFSLTLPVLGPSPPVLDAPPATPQLPQA